MSKTQIGNYVAKMVWKWLQEQKCIEYVPWVRNTNSRDYDPIKTARQQERDELLASLEEVIRQASIAGAKDE